MKRKQFLLILLQIFSTDFWKAIYSVLLSRHAFRKVIFNKPKNSLFSFMSEFALPSLGIPKLQVP